MRHLRTPHFVFTCTCLATITSLATYSTIAHGAGQVGTQIGTQITTRDAKVFTYAQCLRAIDKSVLYIDQVDIDTAQQSLATLAHSCEDVPQVHHNLGVIAAKQGQWETAITAFERAIALAPQTADTVQQLQALHEYQAKKAWQVAFEFDHEISAPMFTWQNSTDQNQRSNLAAAHSDGLRSVATVDFELYNWWHAWDEQDRAAWLDHYVNGYPPPTLKQPRPVSWSSVVKDIRFTASDAAVVLTWTKDGSEHHRWLLLTLAGQRWQIYHEAEL